MKKARRQSLTDLLKDCIGEAESLRGLERSSGVTRQSLSTFMAGQTTLRLPTVEVLMDYFGIECRRGDKR